MVMSVLVALVRVSAVGPVTFEISFSIADAPQRKFHHVFADLSYEEYGRLGCLPAVFEESSQMIRISQLLLSLVATCLIAAGNPSDKKSDGSLGARTVHFPQDQSIGKYIITDWNSDWSPLQNSQALKDARGDVEVPAGQQMMLIFVNEKMAATEENMDLSPLDGLQPTDLQVLTFSPFAKVPTTEADRIKRLTGLRGLGMHATNEVTDKTLAALTQLPALDVLQLPGSAISDEGLKYLAGLDELQLLNISLTEVTDAGLKHLEGMKNLRTLSLTNTEVTKQGVERLKKSLPNCIILH